MKKYLNLRGVIKYKLLPKWEIETDTISDNERGNNNWANDLGNINGNIKIQGGELTSE